jgi:5'(3')-deoxyribonucleotidase
MKIALDIEDTLADTSRAFIQAYNEENNTSYTLKDIEWGLENETIPFGFEFYHQRIGELWHHHEQIPPTEDDLSDKLAALAQLDGVEIDLVTARLNRPDEMKEWLKDQEIFQNEHYNELITAEEKEQLDYDLYIDDNPKMGASQLVFDQPWNQHSDKSNQTRIHSLADAHQYLTN